MTKNSISESKPKNKNYDEWDIDNACRTLKSAEEIKNDPKLLKLVQEKIEKEDKALENVKVDLRTLLHNTLNKEKN